MERCEVEQLLDFATRDWPADWRGNFGGESGRERRRFRDACISMFTACVTASPASTDGNGSSRKLGATPSGQCGARGGLSEPRTVTGGKRVLRCFDDCRLGQGGASIRQSGLPVRIFRSRGHRAEAVPWGGSTGLERHRHGAFYDDDVHRYLGFLEETDGSVGASVDGGESDAGHAGSPTSRRAAAEERYSPRSLP